MDKSYRIHTNISSDTCDTCLNVNMQQDFDFLEVLSLKLKQKDAYRLHSSNYGVIVGRVLANDAFGIPNAKVSVFIEKTDGDSVDMETIYPYKEVTTKDKDGRRYNILPDYSDDECYRVVGTFPSKRLVLDDDVQLDVYDKYWKYSTVTNNAGDFMLFAVPTGSVTVHIEMDLSDIGVLSQKPRDFEYKGYNLTLFDSPSQFKESTNLDDLAQIFSQNKSIFVYPFWGDADNGVACITRSDVQIQYKFEPTCVFMGSIVSDNEGHAIGHKCAPDVDNGLNTQLVGGNGTIEMIRKTTDGLVEEYQIQGNQLIDEYGVWCYQIPMNLDYVGTDEYGNVVPTDNPNKGIPTRTQVRFRFSKNETSDEGFSKHTAKYLVPMNPIFDEGNEIPTISDKGSEIEKMYVFGSATPASCFRDLYWNNVYSVKNYLPKTQVATKPYSKNFCGLKGANLAEDQNQIPFNKLSISLPFVYIALCLIYTIVVWVVKLINSVIICTVDRILGVIIAIRNFKLPLIGRVYKYVIPPISYIGCISLSAGELEGNIAYYPGCVCKNGMKAASCPEEMKSGCKKSTKDKELMDKIQRNLATEFKIIRLDFYQDWVNGCLYMPLWYWRKRKKKTFLFFTLSRAKNDYCSDSGFYKKLKTHVTCNIKYTDNSLTATNNKNSMPDGEKKWHKTKSGIISYNRGLIKPVENKDGLTAYYYAALQATSDNKDNYLEMSKRTKSFKAVRLFATDIILLGNLDPKNLYGIPQFYTCLPSTTSNVPPIATIEESEEKANKTVDNGTEGDSEDSGTTITTGMDWNSDGGKKAPSYKTGLFMDLACTYANTRPKSCINVERLSELGVSLDMKHKVAYHGGGNDVSYGEIDSDGFITKYELDDIENRAMFATLNHIGFIPQEYQNTHDRYETQVYDANTNYLVPKFKYLYPLDFDGRAQVPMSLYKKGFKQAMFDEKDEAYLTFRLGAEKDGKKGRKRHFYHVDGKMRDMPLYNNSYYFYFGINRGNTAIDKFNKLFYSPCVKQKKMPFTLDITTQGMSYCPSAYAGDVKKNSNPLRYIDGVNKNNAYAYIRVTCDDVRQPFSYSLYDSFNNLIVSEEGMTNTDFAIGGVVNGDDTVTCNVNGEIYYQIKGSDGKYHPIGNGVHLDNGVYTLDVVDSDGRRISERVKLDMSKINGEYTATALGTKFYNSATTRIDYICNDDNAFYGEIEMSKFYVDGYSCDITNITGYYDNDSNEYHFCITGNSDSISDNVQARLELTVLNNGEENSVRNCLCDNDGNVNLVMAAQSAETPVHMNIAPKEGGTIKKNFYLEQRPIKDENGNITSAYYLILYVYQPNQYVIKITQGCGSCDNLISNNSSSEIINVLNGEPFMTELNGMPTKFMIGTGTDTTGASIANSSFFYNSNAVTSEANMNIKGWYGLHQEDSYMFSKKEENKTYMSNQNMWEDFLDGLNIDVATPEAKREILKFKFDKMFALSEGAYITTNSSRTFMFSSQGGKQPILYRSVTPTYDDYEKIKSNYVLTDFNGVECRVDAPNIVGYNYSPEGRNLFKYNNSNGNGVNDPHFNNGIYTENPTFLGNYFAAFTRDGSYVTNKTIDGKNIKIERSPSLASISPILNNNIPKVKGKDVFGEIESYFRLAHTQGTQNLTGDTSSRNTLPYLRGMYVDRRLDFDLTILAPAVGNNFDLYSSNLESRIDKNRIWKSGRIFGWLFNGIEMSYDEDYNIISANTISGISEDDEIVYSAATFNKRLEYTYKYDCAHICMTCGYQDKNMGSACTKCCGDTVNHFHGENVENVPIETIDGTIYHPKSHLEDNINFVSADTQVTGKILKGNNKKYTLDDAITWYHKWSGDTKYDWKNSDEDYARWGKWNSISYQTQNSDDSISGVSIGFNPSIDTDNSNIPLIKEFYSSEINGIDIRHLYWSLFNYKRLYQYTSGMSIDVGAHSQGHGISVIENVDLPLYTYSYPHDYVTSENYVTDNLFNGDFNRDDVVQNDSIDTGRPKTTNLNSYPTKRYIDIGNLPQISQYSFETECCSYDIDTEITDDGRIIGETSGGETVELNFKWSSPITVVPPNAYNAEYTNVLYTKSGSGSGNFRGYTHFKANKAAIAFKYNMCTNDNFDVYTSTPILIQVLPEITGKGIDGIGYYKTSNPKEEFGGYGDGKSLRNAIQEIQKQKFNTSSISKWVDTHTSLVNVFTPSGVKISNNFTTKYGNSVNGYFFTKDGEWLNSNDDDFANILFKKSGIDVSKVKVFAILVEREYKYTEDDNLLRHIHTVETSDLYDCRELYIKGISCSKSACTDTNCSIVESYVECKSGDVYDDESESGNEPTTGQPSFYQTLCFEMKFDTSSGTTTPPENKQNEAFADYDMMSYTFRFFDKRGQKFDVSPTNVVRVNECDGEEVGEKYSFLRFTVQWTADMGIMCDTQWQNSGKVEIYAKTSSNFVYKIHKIGFKFGSGGQENPGGYSYDNPAKVKKSIESEATDGSGNPIKYLTDFIIA